MYQVEIESLEMNQVHMALEQGRNISRFSELLNIFWGLMVLALIGMDRWGMQNFNLHLLPVIFSVIIGISFFIHGVIDNRIVFKFSAYGLWLGSIGLFYQPDIDALA